MLILESIEQFKLKKLKLMSIQINLFNRKMHMQKSRESSSHWTFNLSLCELYNYAGLSS